MGWRSHLLAAMPAQLSRMPRALARVTLSEASAAMPCFVARQVGRVADSAVQLTVTQLGRCYAAARNSTSALRASAGLALGIDLTAVPVCSLAQCSPEWVEALLCKQRSMFSLALHWLPGHRGVEPEWLWQ